MFPSGDDFLWQSVLGNKNVSPTFSVAENDSVFRRPPTASLMSRRSRIIFNGGYFRRNIFLSSEIHLPYVLCPPPQWRT